MSNPVDLTAVLYIPKGVRHALLVAAFFKHVVALPDTSQAERLKYLEFLDLAELGIPMAVVKRIDPMSKTEVAMFVEACRVDGRKHDRASYDLLTRDDVFLSFLALNAGLAEAIQFWRPRDADHQPAMVPRTDATPEPPVPTFPRRDVEPVILWGAAAMMKEPVEIRDGRGLIEALRARAAQVGASKLDIDTIGGMPSGYSGKVLGRAGTRGLTTDALGLFLGALGLKLLAIEDPDALARVRGRYTRWRAWGCNQHEKSEASPVE